MFLEDLRFVWNYLEMFGIFLEDLFKGLDVFGNLDFFIIFWNDSARTGLL